MVRKTLLEKLVFISNLRYSGFAIENTDPDLVLVKKHGCLFRFIQESEFWKNYKTGVTGKGFDDFIINVEAMLIPKQIEKFKKNVTRCGCCGNVIYKQSIKKHGGLCVKCRQRNKKEIREKDIVYDKMDNKNRVVYIPDVLTDEVYATEGVMTIEGYNNFLTDCGFAGLMNHPAYNIIKRNLFLKYNLKPQMEDEEFEQDDEIQIEHQKIETFVQITTSTTYFQLNYSTEIS